MGTLLQPRLCPWALRLELHISLGAHPPSLPAFESEAPLNFYFGEASLFQEEGVKEQMGLLPFLKK